MQGAIQVLGFTFFMILTDNVLIVLFMACRLVVSLSRVGETWCKAEPSTTFQGRSTGRYWLRDPATEFTFR